jgi:hypothetical protein
MLQPHTEIFLPHTTCLAAGPIVNAMRALGLTMVPCLDYSYLNRWREHLAPYAIRRMTRLLKIWSHAMKRGMSPKSDGCRCVMAVVIL